MQSKLKLLRVAKAVNEADLADLSLIEAVFSEIQVKTQEKHIENDKRSRHSEKGQHNVKDAIDSQVSKLKNNERIDVTKDLLFGAEDSLQKPAIAGSLHRRLPVINVIPYQGFPGAIQDALETACRIYVSQHPQIIQNMTIDASSFEQQSAHEVLQRRKLSELSVWRKEIMKVVDSSRAKSNSFPVHKNYK